MQWCKGKTEFSWPDFWKFMFFFNQQSSVPSLFKGSIYPERLISGNKTLGAEAWYLIGYPFEKTLHLY